MVRTYDEVAHHVRIASVHEQLDIVVDKVGKERSAVVHPITLAEECLVYLHVA